ncbi:MAG: glycoside hydrolase family 3 N-terminal domain-containing protein [bacterium]|nr:glycoside hydrolase family 3 N-terminal domain-containing protein [bacterium]
MKKIMFLILTVPSFAFLFSYEIKLSEITSMIDSMTLKEKVSQLFFVCMPKKKDFSVCPGGVIPSKSLLREMYSKKFDITKNFSRHSIPPFIGIDQEGGMVDRISFIYKFPSIGKVCQDKKNRKEIINAQISIMSSLGINVNFSPCVDISSKKNSFIKRTKRGISEEPDTIISFARFYMKEHKKKRILNALKHFPGYGDTYDNSDDFITDYRGSEKDFFNNLRVFSSLLDQASFVMMSNLKYPFLDTLPALMSKTIVSFVKSQDSTVIILTDDIACRGFSNPFEVLKKSFNAGCDMFILMNDTLYEHLADSMVYWVSTDQIGASELEKKLVKILLKKEYLYHLSKEVKGL